MLALKNKQIIQTLVDHYDLPETIGSDIDFFNGEILNRHNRVIGRYRYFDEVGEYYISYGDEIQSHRSGFKPCLSNNMLPAFQVYGAKATPRLHAFIKSMMTNQMTDPCYKLSRDAGAFFQGGSNDPEAGWFLIEFWNPKGVKAWMEHLNQHYRNEK